MDSVAVITSLFDNFDYRSAFVSLALVMVLGPVIEFIVYYRRKR